MKHDNLVTSCQFSPTYGLLYFGTLSPERPRLYHPVGVFLEGVLVSASCIEARYTDLPCKEEVMAGIKHSLGYLFILARVSELGLYFDIHGEILGYVAACI